MIEKQCFLGTRLLFLFIPQLSDPTSQNVDCFQNKNFEYYEWLAETVTCLYFQCLNSKPEYEIFLDFFHMT